MLSDLGDSYWHMSDDGVDVGVYVAILDQQLAISVFPSNAEPDLLAAFLGQEMPKESMASSNALAILNSEKGYSGYGSGILDFQKLADELMKPDSATRTYLGPESSEMLASLDAVCVAEIKSMIEKAPRMTGGLTEFSAGAIGMRYELEIDGILAGKLANLVSSTPVATDGDNLMSASLAIQVGKLRAFVLEKATALLASPYQCEALAELNQNASELVTQLNIPMPPMVNNLMGVRVRLDDFNPNAAMPEGTGLLALHVDKPEMFVGMASMMVPGFEALDLANQSEPVRIPPEMLPMADLDIFAMMNKNAIGAAVGEQHAGELGQFMSMKAQDNGTFFSVSYDMAQQLKLQNAFYGSQHSGQEPQSSSLHGLSTVAREAYMSTLGRSRVDMRFSGDGLIVDSRMTFK